MYEFRPPAVVQADADLALALRQGDEAAVRELFARYGALVYTTARRTDESANASADVTVHTFLQAWRNSEAFEPGRSFTPWLSSIARRIVATRASGATVDDAAHELLVATPDTWEQPPDGLEDRVVAAVVSEAHLDPADIYTAADLAAARVATTGARSAWLRAAIVGAVAAFLLLLIGIVLLSALEGSDGSDGSDLASVELRPTGRLPGVRGSISIAAVDAGTRITVDAPGLPPQPEGAAYRATVVLDGGVVLPAGSFRSGADVTLTVGAPPEAVDQFLLALPAPKDTDGSNVDDADVILRAPVP